MSPLPDLRHWMPPEPDRLYADELQLLDTMNRYQKQAGLAPLDRVTEIFSQLDHDFLTTLPELDPYYSHRVNAEYHGTWPLPGGESPDWPSGKGKKVLVYLKRFPELEFFLDLLSKIGMPVVVFCDNIPAPLLQRCTSPTLRFTDRPVDLNLAFQEADVLIHHGGLGTSITALLAGIPSLLIPMHLEQTLTSVQVTELGAATIASPTERDQLVTSLHRLLNNNSFTQTAKSIAARHKNLHSEHEIQKCADMIEELLSQS